MKYASAMRYGGELVDAAECNYDDYDYLKPLCPNCKEVVFLRRSFDRTRGDKTSTVPAHWSHHKGKDPTLVQQCELRVSQYTAEELQKRSAQARGQRLKLFQRWFWTIIKNLPFSHIEGEVLGGVIEPHWEMYDHFPAYRDFSDELVGTVVGVLKMPGFLSGHISEKVDQIMAGEIDYFNSRSSPESDPPPHLQRWLETFKSKVDVRLQKQIVEEAMGYLCSASGRNFLAAILFNTLIPILSQRRQSDPLFLQGFPPLTPDFVAFVMNAAIALVALIPWAEEFEKISKTSAVPAQLQGGDR